MNEYDQCSCGDPIFTTTHFDETRGWQECANCGKYLCTDETYHLMMQSQKLLDTKIDSLLSDIELKLELLSKP